MRCRLWSDSESNESFPALLRLLNRAPNRFTLAIDHLVRGGFPLLVRGEPDNGFLVGWHVDSGASDESVGYDLFELFTGGVVPLRGTRQALAHLLRCL